MTRYYLELKNTQKEGARFLLPLKGNLCIGRDPHCQITINDPRLSRKHCQIFVDDNAIVLKDLGSSNGTFINQKRITTSVVNPGETIYFGKIIFTLIAIEEKKTTAKKKDEDKTKGDTTLINELSKELDFKVNSITNENNPTTIKSDDLISSSGEDIFFDPLEKIKRDIGSEELPRINQSTEEILSIGSMRQRNSDTQALRNKDNSLDRTKEPLTNSENNDQRIADELIGEKFLSYKIIDHIGDGPLARVYKVEHEIMNQFYVLKILEKPIVEHPDVLHLFEKQIKIDSNLMNNGLVEIINAGYTDSNYYILTTFIDNFDLNVHVSENGAMNIKDSLSMILQCIDIIDFVHSKKIVHGGIKPTNILHNSKDQWLISDIGLTSMLLKAGVFEKVNLDERDLAFDLSFCAPESITQKKFTPETDIYSLAAVLYYALSGISPFDAKDIFEMKEKIIASIPESLEVLVKDIPQGISEIIRKAMSKDPKSRYRNIESFRFALNSVHV